MNNKDWIFIDNTLVITPATPLSRDLNKNAILQNEISANTSMAKYESTKWLKPSLIVIINSRFLKHNSNVKHRTLSCQHKGIVLGLYRYRFLSILPIPIYVLCKPS